MGDQINEMLVLFGYDPVVWPGPAYWAAIVLFSVIGIVLAFLGRRRRKRMVVWVAFALMLYPYVVWGTAPVWMVGVALCGVAAWCWTRPEQDGPQRKR